MRRALWVAPLPPETHRKSALFPDENFFGEPVSFLWCAGINRGGKSRYLFAPDLRRGFLRDFRASRRRGGTLAYVFTPSGEAARYHSFEADCASRAHGNRSLLIAMPGIPDATA